MQALPVVFRHNNSDTYRIALRSIKEAGTISKIIGNSMKVTHQFPEVFEKVEYCRIIWKYRKRQKMFKCQKVSKNLIKVRKHRIIVKQLLSVVLDRVVSKKIEND